MTHPTVICPPDLTGRKKFIDYGEGVVYLCVPVALFTVWAALTGIGVAFILDAIF